MLRNLQKSDNYSKKTKSILWSLLSAIIGLTFTLLAIFNNPNNIEKKESDKEIEQKTHTATMKIDLKKPTE
ncbi:hypothetical protein JXR93_05785 [bacterium]|nr:hypothetical protein [bacterium]